MPSTLRDDLPDVLKTVRTRALFVMHLSVRKLQIVGGISGGTRRVGVVFGGSFAGERLSGEVLDGGNDWQVLHDDGTLSLDVRIVLQTQEGAMISMVYRGLRHGPRDVLERLEKGEAVDPSSYYFRITPYFETAAPQYGWLNRVVAVGVGHRLPGGPVYSIFEVL
jgi:hypothetical protein